VLPKGCGVGIRRGSWEVPPIFRFIQREGGIPEEEMHRVFNMGVGMALFAPPGSVADLFRVFKKFKVDAWEIGCVRKGSGNVALE